MNYIILFLFQYINYLHQTIFELLNFIAKYIPIRQWAFDQLHCPKYQKFKVDELPIIINLKQDWNYQDLIAYYKLRYNKSILPVTRRKPSDISDDCICPRCQAPKPYLYENNGKKGQLLCKVCSTTFSPEQNRFSDSYLIKCPHCGCSLEHKKDRKHFILHKCINAKCSYYLNNLKKVDKEDLDTKRYKYKLHYIYREFNVNFFKLSLFSLPKYTSSLKFSKFDKNIMSLCLTYKVNLGLSFRKTAQALKDIHNINISHTQIANYCKTAAVCIKPFVDNFDYKPSNSLSADETYIKVRGVKSYIWLIMDSVSRCILGYQVSDNRGVGPCILTMRMALKHFKELPKNFKFIADGYSAYPLAAQQFFHEFGEKFKFNITQVIGLTNNDAVSKEFRPYKQMIERLNRTYKASYRVTNGFDNYEGANYALSLWVAYYNFLRPHSQMNYQVLNRVQLLDLADTMLGKWQLLIFLGQQEILKMQSQSRS